MKEVMLLLLLTLAACSAREFGYQGYQHPHQVLRQLQVAEKIAEDMRTNPDHELLSLYKDYQQLKPVTVLQHLVYLSKSGGYDISETCANQTIFTLESMRLPDLTNPTAVIWADNVIDSWGKPAPAILQLSLNWVGDFDECQGVQSASNNPNFTLPKHLDFQGKYCTAASSPPQQKGIANPMAMGGGISIGVCMPSGCSEHDIETVLDSLIHDISKNYTTGVSVSCQERDMTYSKSAIAAIVLYCLIGALCLAATLYDFIFIMLTPEADDDVEPLINGHTDLRKGGDDRTDTEILISPHHEKSTPREHSAVGEFLMCFSLYTNGYKLLSTKQAPGSLTCLNGIRFISMLWVILGHTLVFSVSSIKNILTIFSWTRGWAFMVVTNATVSVDSFFVLSGILTSYLFIKELDKKKMGIFRFLTSVPIMYLHRYVRLTPAYGFMILFYACLGLYTFTGPLKPTHTDILDPNCVNYTWSALLYVNNVISPLHECAAWGWYLSNDFQFYLVTPFVVYLLYRIPTAGIILSSVMIVASCGAATGISVKDDLGLGLFGGRDPHHPNPAGQANEMSDYYFAPWARYQSYGVGVLYGYILWICVSKYNNRLPVNRFTNLLLWGLAGAILLSVLYGPHDAEGYVHIATKGEAAFYNGWARTAWSLALGYIILACCLGRGGWVNEFLSWPGFVPVSRMTYCAYLVHPVIMTIISSAHKSLAVWSEITFIYMFAGYAFLSFATAFLFSIVFEAPFMLLDKKYFTGKLAKLSCK